MKTALAAGLLGVVAHGQFLPSINELRLSDVKGDSIFLDPPFNTQTYKYAAHVNTDIYATSMWLDACDHCDPEVIVAVNGRNYGNVTDRFLASGVGFDAGTNIVTLQVWNVANSAQQTYTLNITRTLPQLSEIQVRPNMGEPEVLVPPFNNNTFEYDVYVSSFQRDALFSSIPTTEGTEIWYNGSPGQNNMPLNVVLNADVMLPTTVIVGLSAQIPQPSSHCLTALDKACCNSGNAGTQCYEFMGEKCHTCITTNLAALKGPCNLPHDANYYCNPSEYDCWPGALTAGNNINPTPTVKSGDSMHVEVAKEACSQNRTCRGFTIGNNIGTGHPACYADSTALTIPVWFKSDLAQNNDRAWNTWIKNQHRLTADVNYTVRIHRKAPAPPVPTPEVPTPPPTPTPPPSPFPIDPTPAPVPSGTDDYSTDYAVGGVVGGLAVVGAAGMFFYTKSRPSQQGQAALLYSAGQASGSYASAGAVDPNLKSAHTNFEQL